MALLDEVFSQEELNNFPNYSFIKKTWAGAVFNTSRTHRYVLWRTWNSTCANIAFVGINPSIADENQNDPTIRKCIGFAKQEGYGGLIMVNLFTIISTDPDRLSFMHRETLNTKNSNYWLNFIKDNNIKPIFMWGNSGEKFMDRINEVKKILDDQIPLCLGKTKSGQPKHILYMPYSTKLEIF